MKRKYNNFQDAVVPASVETVAEDDGEFKILRINLLLCIQ